MKIQKTPKISNYNNLAQRCNFIASSPAFENVPFFLKAVSIPTISFSHPEVGGRHSLRGKLGADGLNFGPLSFEMLLDEDLIIYEEFYNIVTKQVGQETGTFGDYSFDFIIEMNNNKGHDVMKFHFVGCRISALGDVLLDRADDGTEYILSIDIEFDRYYIVRDRTIDMIPSIPQKITETSFKFLPNQEVPLDLSDKWLFWGDSLPVLINGNFEMNSTLGGGIYQTPILTDKPFGVEFTSKVDVGTFGFKDYIEIGITEGSGVHSSVNGRTGNSLMSVIIDGSDHLNDGNSNYSYYNIKNEVFLTEANDSEEHKYFFYYEPVFKPGIIEGTAKIQECRYKILKDSVIIIEGSFSVPNHTEVFIYFQGVKTQGSGNISKIGITS